jgi:hypothetical protein
MKMRCEVQTNETRRGLDSESGRVAMTPQRDAQALEEVLVERDLSAGNCLLQAAKVCLHSKDVQRVAEIETQEGRVKV